MGKSRRGPGLIQAVLSYTQDINVFSCWVGTQLSRAQMMQKWENRFEGLETCSEDDYYDSLRDHLIEPPDPEHDPTPYPSGYLTVGVDMLAFVTAGQYLPRDGYRGSSQPYLFVEAKSGVAYPVKAVVPRPHDTVADPETHDEGDIGNPGRVARFDGPPHPEDIFGEVLPAMTLDLVAEWPGLRAQDIARRCQRSREEARNVTQRVVEEGWLREHEAMLYLGQKGMRFVARRDRVSPSTVQARVKDAITQDHKEVGSHRRHTMAINETMIRLHEAGITAFAGWRAVLDIPGGTQLKPDLVMDAETPLGLGLYHIEVERTAVRPEQVAKKLSPYRRAHGAGHFAPAIFVTERPDAEELFRRQRRDLPVLTCTLADVRRGPLTGDDTVWRLDGQAVSLK